MNILFLIFSFNTGGIEKQLIEMANNMSKKGHNISLCVINANYEERLFKEFNDRVNIIKFNRPIGSRKNIEYMIKLSSIIRTKKIKIVHCQEPTGVVFLLFSKIFNNSFHVVETIHDVGESNNYSTIELKIADVLSDRYIAISQAVWCDMIKRGISKNKIVVINNAVNVKRLMGKEITLEHKLSVDKPLIGNVARFFPAKKGQDTLVKAIYILKDKYPAIHCSFAGGIYKGQEGAWTEVKKYVTDHDLNDSITFLGNVNDIRSFIEGIDIFVLPSNYEGFGISLIEAMSMGIPCVASNIDGPREIIRDSSLGVLAEPGNAMDLAEKIDYVICNYDSFDRNKISEYVFENYDIGQMVDKHIRLFETISRL